MIIPLLDLKKQYANLQSLINEALIRTAGATQYIMGPEVKAFETEMCGYLGSKYAITCANGTDALLLSLRALGIGQGDEVITTPYTFFATAEAISNVGATPIFVDVNEDTYNIDVSKIEANITSKTKAILPVHLFGQPAEMDEIMAIANRYHLMVIEDACQAIGSEYKGKKAGTIGNVGCFSFFPTKNLGAFGDGGMVVTDDEATAHIVQGLRVHGSGAAGLRAVKAMDKGMNEAVSDIVGNPDQATAKYYNYMIGYNSRLDEIQAAVLRIKLRYLDEWNERRRHLLNRYNEKLKETSLKLPRTLKDVKDVVHLYVVESEHRGDLTSYLQRKGISTGVYYPVPLHLQKVYSNLGYKAGDFPVAEHLSHRTLALPVYPELSIEEQDYIINCIYQFESGA